MLLIAAGPCNGQQQREPVFVTPHFALHSDLEVNVHDALLAAGTARRAGQPERFGGESDVACFDALPVEQRVAWNHAVDYYAEVIAPGTAFDRSQILPRLALLWQSEDWASGDERTFIAIARSFRSAASPAYERCRWPAQDARNRRWIDMLRPALERHEDAVSRRLVELYGMDWAALPIPVDIVETVSWAGGDSISANPPPGHVWISSTLDAYQTPSAALEVVFHEASHLLTGNRSPLRAALAAASVGAAQPPPGELWHAVLFYTTGEAIRRQLAGQDHVPLIYALDIFRNVRDPIAAAFAPYLDGERSLTESAAALVQALDSAR
jgi:hypothetical protein